MFKYSSIKQNFLDFKLKTNDFHSIKGYQHLIFPCHLGIYFFGEALNSIFNRMFQKINQCFDSFFYQIINSGYIKFINQNINSKMNLEIDRRKESKKTIIIHSSNIYFNIINDIMQHQNIDIGFGLTNHPIYSCCDKNNIFLFGEAHLSRKCAIVSTYNLINESENILNISQLNESRIIKETIHEIGHLILGIDHCRNSSCVMRFSKTIQKIDQKKDELCEECKIKLRDVRTFFNF